MESTGYMISLTADQCKQESEEDKVRWVVLNAVLNFPQDGNDDSYNPYEESLMWARSKDYFPDMEDEVLLTLLRKHDIWNDWEKSFL